MLCFVLLEYLPGVSLVFSNLESLKRNHKKTKTRKQKNKNKNKNKTKNKKKQKKKYIYIYIYTLTSLMFLLNYRDTFLIKKKLITYIFLNSVKFWT